KGQSYVFPYTQNPNFHFENGLLQSKKYYRSDGLLLKENIYEYQRLNEENKKEIFGFNIRKLPSLGEPFGTYIQLYSKYNFLTNVSNVPFSLETRVYDEADELNKTNRKY